jgi:alpha-N-arabinofuranosidase
MYNVHQDATLIPITLKSNDYVLGSDKMQAVSASASKDANGLVHISLVNIDAIKEQEISIDLRGQSLSSVTGRILNSSKLQDFNSFEAPNKVKPSAFKGASLSSNKIKVKLPAHSVVVLEVK